MDSVNPNPGLTLSAPGQEKYVTQQDLRNSFPNNFFRVEHHPVYGNTQKNYRGVRFYEILKSMLSLPSSTDLAELKKQLGNYLIQIDCLDGYKPILSTDIFKDGSLPFLAFEETANDGSPQPWSEIQDGGRILQPGPFYLVWNTQSTYPDGWPFQIAAIRLINKKAFDELSQPNPERPIEAGEFKKGFEVFRNNCAVCHQLQGVGGTQGPSYDQVVPYLSDDSLKDWILRMQAMMVHKPFSPEENESLFGFLRNKAGNKTGR